LLRREDMVRLKEEGMVVSKREEEGGGG